MEALCKCGQPAATTHICDIPPPVVVVAPPVIFCPYHDDRFCLLCRDGWTYEPHLGRHRP